MDRTEALPSDPPSVLRLLLCPTLVLLSACGGGPDGPGEVVRDSAGVEIVENPGAAVERAPRWDVAPEPALEIGSVGGEGPDRFSEVVDAARLPDGTTVVVHRGPPELRFFDGAGSHVGTAGGEGEGPGEFLRPARLLRLPGDTLLVHDRRLNRISRFGPEGDFLGSTRLEGIRAGGVVGRFSDGTLVVEEVRVFGAEGPPEAGVRSGMIALRTVSPTGSPGDTLAVRPARETYVSVTDGRFMVVPRIFGTGPVQAVGQDRVHEGHGGEWEIRTRDPDGRILRIVRLDRGRRPVTDADRDSVVLACEERAGESELRRRVCDHYREMPMPERHPAFVEMRLGEGGNLWVREREDGRRWIVFGPEGRVRAVATFPPRFEPLDIDREIVTGRWEDELEVPYVRVYRLRKDGGEG